MSVAKERLNELGKKWNMISADKRRLIMFGGIASALVASAILAEKSTPPLTPTQAAAAAAAAAAKKAPEYRDVRLVSPPKKDNTYDEVTARVDAANRELSILKDQTAENKTEVVETKDAVARRNGYEKSELSEQLRLLNDEVKLLKSGAISGSNGEGVQGELNLPPPPGSEPKKSSAAVAPPSVPDDSAKQQSPPVVITPIQRKIRISNDQEEEGVTSGSGSSLNGAQSSGSIKKIPEPAKVAEIAPQKREFIPAGTIIEGILLNGMDAPTHSVGQQNPVPALMRIKADAILPNRRTRDIKECFIILSGYGELSTERAKLRTELLSCVGEDGGVIESPIDGYVVDSDGKAGLKGRVVSKQGQIIAKTLLAGTFAGIAQGIAPTPVTSVNTISGGTGTTGTQYQMPNLGSVATSGFAQGASTAANEVAKFYMEMAREMFPVIEINNLSPVTIILVRGASLAIGGVNSVKGRSR